MALTPEDVVNKRFQPTKFREGYDQDEVDDFLDDVVVELRRLGQENGELRQRLIATDAQATELQRGGVVPAMVPDPSLQPPLQPPAQVPVGVIPGNEQPVDPENTNNLLQLARRLHQEHVREGIEKRDALIAEGHTAAARIVSEAEGQKLSELSSLEQERVALEGRVEDLRSFEREYRVKLKGHIEGILHDLDSAAVPVGAQVPVAAPGAVQQDPAAFGAVQQDPAAFGAVQQDPAAFGAVQQDPAAFGAVQQDPAAFGAVQQDPAAPGAVQQDPAAFGAVQQDPAAPGAVPAQPPAGYTGFGGH